MVIISNQVANPVFGTVGVRYDIVPNVTSFYANIQTLIKQFQSYRITKV